MFEWLPHAAEELRGELVEVYWVLLVIVFLFVVLFKFFGILEEGIDPRKTLMRVVVSVLLLWSFKEVANLVSSITDGVADKLGGVQSLIALFDHIEDRYLKDSPNFFSFRQMLMYGISVLCYMFALLGYYATDVAIHFVFTVLYALSPLMILAYVPESTAHITKNLYTGLLTVSTWKILWCLLGTLLFKLTTVPEVQDWDNFIMQALTNICIGMCMLKIPFFAQSLIGDGLMGLTTRGESKSLSPFTSTIESIPRYSLRGAGKGTRKFRSFIKKRTAPLKERFKKFRQERKLAAFYRKNGLNEQKTTGGRVYDKEHKYEYDGKRLRGTQRAVVPLQKSDYRVIGSRNSSNNDSKLAIEHKPDRHRKGRERKKLPHRIQKERSAN